MGTATTANFIDGGTIDPFAGSTKPLTLQEQAALEEQRRLRRIREGAGETANINRRDARGQTREYDPMKGIDPETGKPWDPLKKPDVDNSLSGILVRGGKMVEENPWVIGMPLAPLAGAALAPAAAGGGITAGASAAAPVAVANEATGLAVAGPGFSEGAAAAFNAGATAAPAAGGATTAAAAAPAADAAFSVGGALKEVAPIVGAVGPMAIDAVAGGRTKEEKALLAKQQQMAQEAEARRFQVQESRMNALGQQLLAFNPGNQMMAKMFGPDAAFKPEEMAAMVQNPTPPPQLPPGLQGKEGMAANDPKIQAQFREYLQRKQQYEQGNQQRTDQMMNGMRPVGPGPAALQRRTPQPARKY